MVEGARFLLRRRAGLAAVYAVFLAATACNVANIYGGPIQEGVGRADFLAAVDFIRTRTSPDEVLLSWNPRVLAFYTGHASGLCPATADPTVFREKARDLHAAYLLVFDGDPSNSSRSFAESAKPAEVFQNGGFHLYRLGE
jgi:hypothetical protein